MGVTESRAVSGEAYLAPIYDMGSKGIMARDVSRHSSLAQQQWLPVMPEEKLPEDADPILRSNMGWQCQHDWWRNRLGELGIRQSMSRKDSYIDNTATEQMFGRLKDEFYTSHGFVSYEEFESGPDMYIIRWGTGRRQIRLERHTPEESRNMSLTA